MADTSSRPQRCFVIMPYAPEFTPTYLVAIKPAIESCGLECIRADDDPKAGSAFDLLHQHIRDATLCIGEFTGPRANVAAEVGIAMSLKKPLIMITRDALRDLPFDFHHLKFFQYAPDVAGHEALRALLVASIRATLGPGTPVAQTETLKEMLVPASLDEKRARFVVAASPLSYRQAFQKEGGWPKLRGTTSDFAGIRGLIQAFGTIFGLNRLPELLNPGDFRDEVVTEPRVPMNLYSIASPKANRWTGLVLDMLYKEWTPAMAFKADPTSKDLRNVRLRVELEGRDYTAPGDPGAEVSRWYWDFGLVIRAPYPTDPDRMVLVLAGRSSLGTHAASLAATSPEHIRRIKELLRKKVDLNDHRQAFWAVAHMSRMRNGETDDEDLQSLEVPYAEAFRARRR